MTEAEQAAQDCERHRQEMMRQIVAMNAYLLPAMLELFTGMAKRAGAAIGVVSRGK